jgi:hypothetical protein
VSDSHTLAPPPQLYDAIYYENFENLKKEEAKAREAEVGFGRGF